MTHPRACRLMPGLERVGVALAPFVQTALGPGIDHLVALQIGELAWYAVIAAGVVTIVVLGWARSSASARADAGTLGVFFLAFAFCAVVLDSVHSLFPHGTAIDTVLTVLEDGGELVSMSPAVAFAFALAVRRPGGDEDATSTVPGLRAAASDPDGDQRSHLAGAAPSGADRGRRRPG